MIGKFLYKLFYNDIIKLIKGLIKRKFLQFSNEIHDCDDGVNKPIRR